MPLLDFTASVLVLLTGGYLVAFGLFCALRPLVVARFLGAFASTPLLHGGELLLRVIVGAALLHRAPTMRSPPVFAAAGWVLVVTSVLLALVPWRVHARFARAAVPEAMRYPHLLAAGSLLAGAAVIWAWGGAVIV